MPREPLDEWIDEAIVWLAEHAGESIGLEQALRAGRWRGARHLAAYQTAAGIEAISLVTAEGRWLLEGTSERAAVHLLGLVAASWDGAALRLDTSAEVEPWVRPLLASSGRLQREGELVCLVCRQAPDEGEGRWAEAADLPILAALGAAAWPAGEGPSAADWQDLVASRRVALLQRGGDAVGILLETETSRFAGLGPLLLGTTDVAGTLNAAGRQRLATLAASLVAFAARELLRGSGAGAVLHRLAVEERELADLFGRAGFAPAGHTYRAWLGAPR